LRVFLVIVLLLLASFSGCISNNTEEERIMETISVYSDVFEEGGTLSKEYTCDGKNISPDIGWKGIPEGTKSIALIMDDPDAPGRTFVHWVIYNIPEESTGLPPGVSKNESLSDGSLQGKNDLGEIGYYGPCPPPGKPHRYFFKVYALDTKLDLKSGVNKSKLEDTISGHVLAKGELIGKYGR
jgi:Raf kinase inhibitor-like YbhB/YbcL family protein